MGSGSFKLCCSSTGRWVYLHLWMNTFRLSALNHPTPNHMFDKWQSQDSNPELVLSLPSSSHTAVRLLDVLVHTFIGQGLETTFTLVPSPQAGH